MLNDFHVVSSKFDEKNRVVFESYSDGSSFEREFDDNYKNGEIPAVVIEYKNNKVTY